MSNTLTGRIIEVGKIQQFTNSEKKQFVIETEGKYPNHVPFELWNDRVSLIQDSHVDQTVTVHYDLKGRSHNGNWYLSANAWKVEFAAAEQLTEKRRFTDASLAATIEKLKNGEVSIETVLLNFNATSEQMKKLTDALPKIEIAADELPF